jgi:hypothetical protein
MQYGSKSWAPGTKNIFGFTSIRTQIVYDISKWSPHVVGQHRCLVLFWYRRCLCLYSLFVVWWIFCCLLWRNSSQTLPVIGTNREAKVRTRKNVREKFIKVVGFGRAAQRACALHAIWLFKLIYQQYTALRAPYADLSFTAPLFIHGTTRIKMLPSAWDRTRAPYDDSAAKRILSKRYALKKHAHICRSRGQRSTCYTSTKSSNNLLTIG